MKHCLKSLLKISIISLLLTTSTSEILVAQDQDAYHFLIKAIDSNNTTLAAYKKSGEAAKMKNKTGLTPDDPEIGVNYMRMSPRIRNQRLDYNVSQSFDFPSAYTHRKNRAEQQNEWIDTDYFIFRANLIQDAIKVYLQWIYYQQLSTVLKKKMTYAQSISKAYQKAFEVGSVNILDRNKAQVNAANAQKEYELNQIEIHTAYRDLLRYNQGLPYQVLPDKFPNLRSFSSFIHPNSETHLQQNGELQILQKEVELNRTEEKVIKAECLPKFSIGFMREQDIEVDYKGVMLGMSIPLWQKKNTRKYARLNTEANAMVLKDQKAQYRMQVELLQDRATNLYNVMSELKHTISQTRGLELLKKALDMNEITILEYLVEQSMYFDLTQKYLETEMNLHSTLVDLQKWEF